MLDVEQTSFAFDGVPPYLSNLKELKILDISETYFFGELDGSIFAPLQNLMYLEMGGNIYNSTIPSEIANLPNLEAFYLYDTGLWGDIELVPKMHKIVELWLDQNPDLEGTIPRSIGNLQNLASFSVTHCDLSGQIPTQFGKLSELEQVSVTVGAMEVLFHFSGTLTESDFVVFSLCVLFKRYGFTVTGFLDPFLQSSLRCPSFRSWVWKTTISPKVSCPLVFARRKWPP